MAGEKPNGFVGSRERIAWGLFYLIVLQVGFGVVTRTPIDIAVLGLLSGLLTAMLGITAVTGVARALRKDDPDAVSDQ